MNPFEKENIASQFLTDENFCNTSKGKLVEDCKNIRNQFKKELHQPGGCSSCRKKSLFNKYKNIIIKKLND